MTSPAPVIDVVEGSVRIQSMDLGRMRVSAARFPPAHRLPDHRHARGCVSVVLEGGFVQRFPGRTCECPPGGVITKPPDERHEDRWFQAYSRHLIVEPDPGRHEELGEGAALVERVHHGRDPLALALARRMRLELAHPDGVTGLALEGLALELLSHLRRDLGRGERSADDPPPWLERVRELLHDRFADTLTLDELAREAGVHRSHLARTFSSYYGRPVGAYQRALRLEAAKRRLLESEAAISRIAAETGFADQSHLTRLLKEETGITPALYRRLRPGGSEEDGMGRG